MSDALKQRAYNTVETAQILGCTRQHVSNLIARGELRSVKLGRKRLIPAAVIDELLTPSDG